MPPSAAEMATIARALRGPGSYFFLFGPRGTGKSTWLRRTFPDALVVYGPSGTDAIEVKRRRDVRSRDLRGLRAFL